MTIAKFRRWVISFLTIGNSLITLLLSSYSTETFSQSSPQLGFNDQLKLVDVFTTWCKPCKQMDRDTYENEEIKSLIANLNFVKLDADLEENREFVKKFEINTFPTTLIFDSQQNLLSKKIGYLGPEAMKKFIKSTENRTLESVDPKRLNSKEYLLLMREKSKRDSAVFEDYYSKLDLSEKFEIENLYILSGYVNDCRDPEFEILLKAQDLPIFDSEYSIYIQASYKNSVEKCKQLAIENTDESLVQKVIDFELSRKNLLGKDETKFMIWEEYLRKTGNNSKYLSLVVNHCNDLILMDSLKVREKLFSEYNYMKSAVGEKMEFSSEEYMINNLEREINSLAQELHFYSQYILANGNLDSFNKDALFWILKALSIQENPEFLLTGSKLLFKIFEEFNNYLSVQLVQYPEQYEMYLRYIKENNKR